ncbi:TatD family hydrolase [bacterium]|nr:TatD family hydrolase [bacterium]
MTHAPYIDAHCHHASVDAETRTVRSFYAQTAYFQQEITGFCSFGIHPWHAGDISVQEGRRFLEEKLQFDGCIAVGEVGLDRLRGPNLEIQQEVLRMQLEFAEERNLPVILHNVRCSSEFLHLRGEYGRTPWLMHGFQGAVELAQQFIEKDVHLSIGPALLERKSRFQELLQHIPLEKILFESDDTRQSVRLLYAQASILLGIEEKKLREKLAGTFYIVFGVQP